MSPREDNPGFESYREIVARRHRAGRWRRRVVTALVVGAIVVAVPVFWISQQMIEPPRERIGDSARPVLGFVLRDGPGGEVRVAETVGPARAAGLRPGDEIESVDGETVDGVDDLRARIREMHEGDLVRVRARRPKPAGVVLADVRVEVRPVSPADLGLDFQEVAFSDPSGLTLRGWYLPAPPAAPAPAPGIAYGHGNGTDRRHWLDASLEIHHAGFAQLLFDFAGRGESEGEVITLGAREAGDLRAALDFLAARPEVDGSRLFLAGRSMGAAAAILAAADGAPVRGLVLDSPFASLPRVVDETVRAAFPPAVVLRPLAFKLAGWRAHYDPDAVLPIDAIRKVRVPILILHGTRDHVVPIAHARELAKAAGGRARLVPIKSAGHNDRRTADVLDTIVDFLRPLSR